MILLDSDLVLIDQRYPNDPRFVVNRQVIQQIQADAVPLGITSQALLEVVGVLSFNVPPARVPRLARFLTAHHGFRVYPDLQQHPDFAGCTVAELLTQMSRQMSLGDAVQAVQIERHAGFANSLLTWNARHFQGKLMIPVLTPQEWLNQRLGGTP